MGPLSGIWITGVEVPVADVVMWGRTGAVVVRVGPAPPGAWVSWVALAIVAAWVDVGEDIEPAGLDWIRGEAARVQAASTRTSKNTTCRIFGIFFKSLPIKFGTAHLLLQNRKQQPAARPGGWRAPQWPR